MNGIIFGRIVVVLVMLTTNLPKRKLQRIIIRESNYDALCNYNASRFRGIWNFRFRIEVRGGEKGGKEKEKRRGKEGGRGCIVLSWLSASKWPPSISDAKWPRTKRLGSPRCAKWRVDGLDSLLSFHSLACRFLGRMKKEGESSTWKKIEIIENWSLKIICIKLSEGKFFNRVSSV